VVKAIAAACAPAGITVQDAASDHTGPQSLRNKEIEALLASTGGAVGSGSSGSSSMDAYDLHTANGNNLSGYSNPQVDGIIDNLAITTDAKEIARLLGDSAGVLWNDMPTLPLYRQQRTVISSRKMEAVSGNPTRWSAGWNMDRWTLRE
jgi:peptide/nickel transport system substrate-binding protein